MREKGKCVMIVGLGDLGGWVLELLARSQGVSKIIAVDVREEYGLRKTRCAAAGASMQGYFKNIEFHKMDVNNIDETAELLGNIQPDVIYSAVTLQSWWVRELLPKDIVRKVTSVGGGPLIPLQIVLIYKLMQAVKQSGITTHVLNNSGPDYTNPVLWRNGLGPTLGGGNLQFLVEKIRHRISKLENVPVRDVTVLGVGIHAVVMQDPRKVHVPYFMKCMVRDEDITNKYNLDSLITEEILAWPPPTQMSWLLHPLVAASAVQNILGIINDTNELSHAPGPNGLVGCYPVRLNASGVEVVLPEELTLEEAIKINTNGLKWDGYQEIKDDGTMIFTREACEVYQELLEIDIDRQFRLEDAEERARELLSAYKSLTEKYKTPTYLY